MFRVIDKARWIDDHWDRMFNLINDFKNEYGFPVSLIDVSIGGGILFNVGEFTIMCSNNSQGFWITLEANTSKADFDEKYEFIFSRIGER